MPDPFEAAEFAIDESSLQQVLAMVRPRDPKAIELLHKHLAGMPTVTSVGMPVPVDDDVLVISGTLKGRQPGGKFKVVIVFGPDQATQMIGGVILERQQRGGAPEVSDWHPIDWDHIPWLIHEWARYN